MSASTDERIFRSQLLAVLREIRNELKIGNNISKETNSKFDSEVAILDETIDSKIKQDREVGLAVRELNRNIVEKE
jgi:hypothetical protein